MAKKRIQNYKFIPGVSALSNAYPNAYALLDANINFISYEANAYINQRISTDTAQNYYPVAVTLLQSNKNYILAEMSAWIEYQISNNLEPFVGYEYNSTQKSKCERDVGYLIDAYAYDLRYGGNEKTIDVNSEFYINDELQLYHVPQELATHTFLADLMSNYVLKSVLYPTKQSPITQSQILGVSAESGAISKIVTLSNISNTVISNGVAAAPPKEFNLAFANYSYNTSKCIRDTKYVLNAYLHDLRYGGNVQTLKVVKKYWVDGAPQVDGNRQAEIETHAFIRDLIRNVVFHGDYEAKCERDVGYLLDGVQYDVALGTNYNSVFLGIAEYNSLDIDDFVLATIQATGGAVAALPAVANSATALSRSNAFFSEVVDIAQNGRSSANTLTFTNPTSATLSQIAAKDKLIANKSFLATEVNSWVALNYPNSTHDIDKCTRDIGYAINAVCYDILYGGNSATYDQAKFFFYGFADGAAGIDPTHTEVTVAAYDYLKSIIGSIVQGQTISKTGAGPSPNELTQVLSGNNASAGDALLCQNLIQITSDVIDAGSQAAANQILANIVKTYPTVTWASTELQNAKTAIQTNKASIISQVAVYDVLQDTYERQHLGAIRGESGAGQRISSLYDILQIVVNDGVEAAPQQIDGVGTIDIHGKWTLDQILLITNVSSNVIIYNFADPNAGSGIAELDPTSPDKDIEIDYGFTHLSLNFDTSSMNSTDQIQIFVEDYQELRVRPYEFGTDAIERQRVANSQSMLDADFEYGLQPTKWQALALSRSYPGAYEVPGTELTVQSVVTDASAPNGFVGQSLITVTTEGAHGLAPAEVFTMKNLDSTVLGFSRAEGTFLCNTTPTSTTFTYYAKARVGSIQGTEMVLSTTSFRRAKFFTGADIGTPTFSVFSQGASGEFSPALVCPAGTFVIPYAGSIPVVNAPVSASGFITPGTTITAINGVGSSASTTYTGLSGTNVSGLGVDAVFDVVRSSGVYTVTVSNGGTGYLPGNQIIIFGEELDGVTPGNDCLIEVSTIDELTGEILTITASGTGIASGVTSSNAVEETANPGVTIITLADSSGVIPGLAFNRGDGTPTLVNTVEGDTITISRPLTSTIFGSSASFSNLNPIDILGSGTGATFDITRTGTVYSGSVNTAGADYEIGDSLLVSGADLGGNTGQNDAFITVTSISVSGGITGFDIDGEGIDSAFYTDVTTSNITGQGSGATFNVERTATTYSGLTINSTGLDYSEGDVIRIDGTLIGGDPLIHDITVVISTVSVLGAIETFTFDGVAHESTETTVGPNNTTSGIGTGALFDVTRVGTLYQSVEMTSSGDPTRTPNSFNVFGSTAISIDEFVYGDSSLRIFNALAPSTATNWFEVTANPDFIFGTAAFTIEFDLFKVGTGTNQTILDMRQAEPDNAIVLGFDATEHLYLYVNGSLVGTSINPLDADTWYHIEISSTDRTVSGTTKLFVDGNEEISFTDTLDYGSGQTSVPIILGADYTGGGDGFRGYIDEFRVSTDIARHTTTFTPPTAPYDNDGSTVLLLHFDGTNNSQTFEDDVGGYKVNDTITILGSDLNGTDVTHDLVITVTSANFGIISSFNWDGVGYDTEVFSNIVSTNVSGQGSGLTFNISKNGEVYENIGSSSSGTGYIVNDQVVISGTDLGGASPANDITIRITSVGPDGSVGTFEVLSGVAAVGVEEYLDVAGESIESPGSNVIVTISKEAGSYTLEEITNGGSNYSPGNKLRVLGTFLAGSPVIHDAIIVVDEVDEDGAITAASVSGSASGGQSIDFFSTVILSDPIESDLPTNASVSFSAIAKIQVTFDQFHGLVPGSALLVRVTSTGLNQNLASGNFYVEEVPEANVIRYTARAQGSINITGFTGLVYSRTDAFFVHRPFDGGVQLGTGGPQHAAQAIRMSKNYIRYQSGKGLMYTTGALFAPSYDISSATSTGLDSGSIITFITDDIDHGLQIGATVRIIGVETTGYNNDYEIYNIIDEKTFQVLSISKLGSKVAVLGQAQVSMYQWSGATVRAGSFDEQNGMYWQYDGQRLGVGIRSSTFQLSGFATATPDSNLIVGVNTRFRDQLIAGEKIVIRGMTHTVSHVIDQNTMTVTPDFRGAVVSSKIKLCKVIDRIFYQDEWNRDKADGTGPSGYNIDVTKMQMIGLQYSWYGAGFIDWMLRGKEGYFLFVHRVRNNNVNTEAFMRSANLPVRYEVSNDGAIGKLTTNMTATSTIIPLEDTFAFPDSGVVYVDNEMIAYTGKNSASLTGLSRSASLQNFVAGSYRTYTAGEATTHSKGTGVILVSNKTSPNISHWGSAYLTDGGFDSDRGYLFNYQATSFVASTIRKTAFLIRLSPSVSNAVVGDLGTRDLINRAQLLLQGIEVTAGTGTASGIVIEGILNPSNYPEDSTQIEWRSLSNPALGGQPSFAQIAQGASVTWDNLFEVSFTANTVDNYNRSNQLRFQAAAIANIRVGMVVGSPTAGIAAVIPGGTTVSGLSGIFNIQGINYRQVYFNRQFTGNIPNNSIISFTSIASFAAPGETIFSFVGLPSNQTALDLTDLKEITNTAIGGRGVYPNGPDVLAINCYLTSGQDQEVSIVLRWSEAQA